MQLLRDIGVHRRHHVVDGLGAGRETPPNLLFALAPMGHEGANMGLRLGDGRPVRGPIESIVALKQLVEARHVALHVAVRRRDDAGRPAHDVIAAEQRALFAQRVADVVGGMAGGVDALHGPVVAFDQIAIANPHVWLEVHVASFLDLYAGGDLAGAVAAEAVGLRVAPRTEQPAARRMIHVRVRDQHVGDGLAGGSAQDGIDVCGIRRARVDHSHVAAAHDVGASAVERERAWVLGDDPAHARRNAGHLAVLEIELAAKGNGDHFSRPVACSIGVDVGCREAAPKPK